MNAYPDYDRVRAKIGDKRVFRILIVGHEKMEENMDAKLLVFMLAVILLGTGIYLKLCKLLVGVRDLTVLMRDMNKHVIGDADDPDSTMIKPSLKELIVNRCLGIENEIVRLRYGIFGERTPAIDGVNILDTLVDIKPMIANKLK